MMARLRARCGPSSIIVACCALAAAPLVSTPIFALDWVNHGWYAAYVTHILTTEGTVPLFVNTPALVGNPVLVFYGTALYAALSPLVWLFGPDLAMRLAVVAVLLVPALSMLRFFLMLGVDRLTAGCLTICLTGSVYQLTNIYTRGAVTEFFGYQLILLGAVVLLSVLVGQGPQWRARALVFGFASLALGALAHPPTFATVGLFLGLPAAALGLGLVVSGAAPIRRQPLAWALAATTLAPLTLWLQIVVAHRAALGGVLSSSDLTYFPLAIDHWISRFWPFSIDLRVLGEGYNLVSTPFLSAPVNSMALLLAALVMLGPYLRPLAGGARTVAGRAFAAAASLAIVASLLLSLPILPAATSGRLGSIQFAYRLVNIVNLAAILAVLGLSLLRWRRDRGRTGWHPLGPGWRHLLVAAATVSTAAIGSKVLDVHLEFTLLPAISRQQAPLPTTHQGIDGVQALITHGIRWWTAPETIEAHRLAMRAVDRIPSSQYGMGAFGMAGIYQRYVEGAEDEPVTTTLKMVGLSAASANVRCPRRCALLTNVVASRWAAISMDGYPVQSARLAIRPDAPNAYFPEPLVTILAEPGDHRVEVLLGSPQTAAMSWSILWLVVLFWVSGLTVLVRTGAAGRVV